MIRASSISVQSGGFLTSVCLFLAACALTLGADAATPIPAIKVSNKPKQPKSGETVVSGLSGARHPGKYEIHALWESGGGSSAEIPTKGLQKDHTYRIRARVQDARGDWSHWSAPTEFTIRVP